MDITRERRLETAGLVNGQKNTINWRNGQRHQPTTSNGARQIDSSSLSPVFHGFPSPKHGELAMKYKDIHALYQNSYGDNTGKIKLEVHEHVDDVCLRNNYLPNGIPSPQLEANMDVRNNEDEGNNIISDQERCISTESSDITIPLAYSPLMDNDMIVTIKSEPDDPSELGDIHSLLEIESTRFRSRSQNKNHDIDPRHSAHSPKNVASRANNSYECGRYSGENKLTSPISSNNPFVTSSEESGSETDFPATTIHLDLVLENEDDEVTQSYIDETDVVHNSIPTPIPVRMSSPSHSGLFVQPYTAQPLLFGMKLCKAMKSVQSSIWEGGGSIEISDEIPDSTGCRIELGDPEWKVTRIANERHPVFSYQYISDCVKQNRLLANLRDYCLNGDCGLRVDYDPMEVLCGSKTWNDFMIRSPNCSITPDFYGFSSPDKFEMDTENRFDVANESVGDINTSITSDFRGFQTPDPSFRTEEETGSNGCSGFDSIEVHSNHLAQPINENNANFDHEVCLNPPHSTKTITTNIEASEWSERNIANNSSSDLLGHTNVLQQEIINESHSSDLSDKENFEVDVTLPALKTVDNFKDQISLTEISSYGKHSSPDDDAISPKELEDVTMSDKSSNGTFRNNKMNNTNSCVATNSYEVEVQTRANSASETGGEDHSSCISDLVDVPISDKYGNDRRNNIKRKGSVVTKKATNDNLVNADFEAKELQDKSTVSSNISNSDINCSVSSDRTRSNTPKKRNNGVGNPNLIKLNRKQKRVSNELRRLSASSFFWCDEFDNWDGNDCKTKLRRNLKQKSYFNDTHLCAKTNTSKRRDWHSLETDNLEVSACSDELQLPEKTDIPVISEHIHDVPSRNKADLKSTSKRYYSTNTLGQASRGGYKNVGYKIPAPKSKPMKNQSSSVKTLCTYKTNDPILSTKYITNWVPRLKGKQLLIEGNLLDFDNDNPNHYTQKYVTSKVLQRKHSNLVITKGGEYCLEGRLNIMEAMKNATPKFIIDSFCQGVPEQWQAYAQQWRGEIKGRTSQNNSYNTVINYYFNCIVNQNGQPF